jgi:hypothetical protein
MPLTDPRVIVAVITVSGGIVVAYWQFVYRRKNDSAALKNSESGNTSNTVIQAPIINVSPSINLSPDPLDIRLKEYAVRQNELAEQKSLCREKLLTTVQYMKRQHKDNNLVFREDQLREWLGEHSDLLYTVLDDLRTQGRARSTHSGYWLID